MAFKLFKFVIAGLGTVLAWFSIYKIYGIYQTVWEQLKAVLGQTADVVPWLIGFSIGLIMASWGLRALWGDRLNEIKKRKKQAKKDKKRLKQATQK